MKFFKKLIAYVLMAAFVVFSVLTVTGYVKYRRATEQMPLSEVEARLRQNENYTEYADIAPLYIKSVVAVEDRRFYLHHGFDILGTARAIITDIKERAMVEGGSSITQQLAKNLYFPKNDTLTRKISEIFTAWYIEREADKEKILELYFNCIYYGSGYYCIYDASRGYFGKTPANLDADEATLLAGVPNAPSVYSPKVNPELARKRQQKVISSALKWGELTSEERKEVEKLLQ